MTSDHGMEQASFNNSIDLSDYVDISKFKSYGGLTQINIFPNSGKLLKVIGQYLFKVEINDDLYSLNVRLNLK